MQQIQLAVLDNAIHYLSNAGFFKRGERFSKLWRSLTRRNTQTTNEAALDK